MTPIGYVEAYYAYNFRRPSNAITNLRGFDNRHDTFSLSNVALGAAWEVGPLTGKLILQVGSTPSTYYLSEPPLPGSGGASSSGTEVWKYLQEANVGWKAPLGRGLLLQAGLFLSPIGPEVVPVKDNWNWSRSNLFFGLPFYHTGARATYAWTETFSSGLSVFNGWNSVVDNNGFKSIAAHVAYEVPERVLVQVLYFGGVERPRGAPEGPYWRHDLDAYARLDLTRRVSVLAHANAGFEPNRYGTSVWYAGALYGRFKAADWLFLAARLDRFHEDLAGGAAGSGATASPLFWGGAKWVSAGTATVDLRPVDFLSFRAEYRHDQAQSPSYFGRETAGDGTPSAPYVPSEKSQDTVTLGVTGWL